MSNFDCEIDPSAEARLRAGEVMTHPAWNFHGTVVFRGGRFVEWVRYYGTVVCRHTADTLAELQRDVNDAHGWA